MHQPPPLCARLWSNDFVSQQLTDSAHTKSPVSVVHFRRKHNLPFHDTRLKHFISLRARTGCCAVVEVEGAFFIGLVSAVNYLAFSRFLELVNIDDMVCAPRARQRSTRERKQPSCVLWYPSFCTPMVAPFFNFFFAFRPIGDNFAIAVTVVLPW